MTTERSKEMIKKVAGGEEPRAVVRGMLNPEEPQPEPIEDPAGGDPQETPPDEDTTDPTD